MTFAMRKIKSFKKTFTKEEQMIIILSAIVGIIFGIALIVGGIMLLAQGMDILFQSIDTFLRESFGFGLY